MAGGALYFTLYYGNDILKYDLGSSVLSVIKSRPLHRGKMTPVTVEDGGLGVAGVVGDSLHLWSWRPGPGSVAGWVQQRVIELDTLIPIVIGGPSSELRVVGFAEGAHTIFMSSDAGGVFAFELKTGRVRKIMLVADWNRQ
uniref:Uncharacterized protein n=1 Tax=Arundo donax TaxID=35708 RepID=A0A0A9CHY1_ARUDO